MAGLLRHRQTKEAATDRLGLWDAESCFLLYPKPGEDLRVTICTLAVLAGVSTCEASYS